MIKKVIIIFFSTIFFSSLVAAEKDQEVRLKGLFKNLQNTFDLTKARKIEDEIWDVWIWVSVFDVWELPYWTTISCGLISEVACWILDL